jgi:hypothetical protein
MKKFVVSVAVLLFLVTSFGALFITENAGLVGAALTSLKFESLPGNPNLVGAPPQFKVTKATIEFLQKIQKDGKTIEVQNDGSIKVK